MRLLRPLIDTTGQSTVAEEEELDDGASSDSSVSDDEDENGETYFERKSDVLDYFVEGKTVKDVRAEKLVPIYKLLPGFRDQGTSLVMQGGKVMVGTDASARKLERQTLGVNQLVFGLLKYRQLIDNEYPARGKDIDRHIANIINVSVCYSGEAFFFYHNYVWSHFFGAAIRQWGGNWFTIDPTALHAAIARANTAHNYCDHCSLWLHDGGSCPFQLKEPSPRGDASRGNAGRSGGTGTHRQQPAGPTPCGYFNSSVGCTTRSGKCRFPHICSFCKSPDHGVNACDSAPSYMKL
jgi:hypothetical protein